MPFSADAERIARDAMLAVRPELADQYSLLVRFLATQPSIASSARGGGRPEIGTAEYIRHQASLFAGSRNPKAPQAPQTIPDKMVSVILEQYFDIPSASLERAKNEHQLSMGAENLVGELLERYLASVMEPLGWVWCSGAMVRAVDFVKPPEGKNPWRLLQVKNRDNSENSSSSAIRGGTEIEKWFRTFSRTGKTNWEAFPCEVSNKSLTEKNFETFVRNYLDSIKLIS